MILVHYTLYDNSPILHKMTLQKGDFDSHWMTVPEYIAELIGYPFEAVRIVDIEFV